ncbi:MAG: tetratricopeptide repeat protein [Bradyrhizobium sp.]|nr:MAG: tetratricopeptide repeat protein [Bradyrhizobium sp.]
MVPDFRPTVRANLLRALLATGGGFAFVAVASANPAPPNASPAFEIGQTQSGNYLSALVAGDDRDTAAASIFSREALRADPRNIDLIERAFAAALADGDVIDGFPLADRLVGRDPNNSLARLALAARAISQGQYVVARIQLASGEAGKAHDVTTTLLTAWSFAGVNDQKRALDALDTIKEPALAVFRDYHAGLIADLLGNGFEAERRLKAAYEADKKTLRLADAYARSLAHHGDIDGAKKVYQEFSALIPTHPVIVAAMADIAAGKPLAPVVHSARDGAAEALYGLGGAGTHQGDELAALIYLRLALYLKPDHDLAAVTVANLFEDLKRANEAIRAYDMVPANSPMRESAEIQSALELDDAGRSDEAMTRMQAIVAAHASDPDAWSAMGSLQRSAKAYEDAAASYDKAIALIGTPQRNQWTLFYFRGICFERAKQWPKAEADFKKALELFPDQPQVLNYLGYSWVDQGINLDEAFKMLRRAVELRPNDGYIVDSLGWADFKLGHYQEAADELEKAIDLKPADPVVNDHLGDAYWRVDRKIEAHFQWNHARDMKPEPDDLPNILKKIESGLPDAPIAAVPQQDAAPPAPSPAVESPSAASPPDASPTPAPNSGG